jgi:hypothetical protein
MNHIDEAIGRCAEMGAPAHFTHGLGLLSQSNCTAQVVAGLSILGEIAKSAARRGVEVIITTADGGSMPIEESILREAYAAEGIPEMYSPSLVRFTGWDNFAMATEAAATMMRDKCAANFMFGFFYTEVTFMAETGAQLGMFQMGGPNNIFVMTCNYFVIGEELMAAGAVASGDPLLVGSILSQDLTKTWLVSLMIIGSVLAFLGNQFLASLIVR